MPNLNFVRMESEPCCFVKKGATPKDSIIVVVRVDDLLSVQETKESRQLFVQLAGTLTLKPVEYVEIGKSVLFLGDHSTKCKGKDACGDNMLAMLSTEGCKPTDTDGAEGIRCKRRRRGARRTGERDVEASSRSSKVSSGDEKFFTNQGPHETTEESLTLHPGNARRAPGTGSTPGAVDGGGSLADFDR